MTTTYVSFLTERALTAASNCEIHKSAVLGYLDKFLSKRSFNAKKNPWATRLLSMACLSLAAKMEEVSVVPPLLEFCVEDYSFESLAIQNMELMVLNELGWKMGFIPRFLSSTSLLTRFSIALHRGTRWFQESSKPF